jgi:peptide/nickel transport system substrate-binding protein
MKKARIAILMLVVLVLALTGAGLTGAQEEIPRGGTVVVSEGQQAPFVANFNPYAPDPTRWSRSSIYEPLVIFNPVNAVEPTPWLADSYEYAEDLMSLTYHLHEGIKWSDGEDFNADDVVFTIQMIVDNPSLDILGILDFVTGAEKVDDFTVKVNLNRVYTQADTVLGQLWPVPEHIWSQVEDVVTFTDPDPVGTGPLTEVVTVNEQVLEICRNENYWKMGEDGQPLPYIDCMRMPVYPGNDPANLAAINGEIDWIANFMPDIDATFVAANPENHHYYFWPGGAVVQLYMNTTKAPYDDVNFRRAISQAIDYESVTSIGMYGYTTPSNAVALGEQRYGAWISQEALDRAAELNQTVYDPDAAMASLDAAGYVDADGDGWRDLLDGSPLEFKVQVVNGWTDWVTSVQIITQNLQDIGLNATMETPDFGAWLNNLQYATYDVSIGWGTAGRTPWDHYRNIMDSSLITAENNQANAQLWGRWTSEETDALINSFVQTADAAEQQDILNQLQMAYVENVPTIPLFPGPTWYEWTTYRFTGWPTQEDYYTQGSSWTDFVAARLIVLTKLHCVSAEACAEAD